MPRVLRSAGSFAIVLVAYWTYALVAVPLIEPPAELRRDKPLTEQDRQQGSHLLDDRLAELRELFPPGSWVLKDPKILESDQVKLVMQDYRNLGDGRVEIRPCTIIFSPDGPADDEAQRRRRAVILEAPEGAVMEFDQPLDLGRMKIGRLVAGQLTGRITIRSKGKLPGPEDDLMIVTRDVELTEHNVWSPHPVDFRWGANYGRGHHMHIKLLPRRQTEDPAGRGPNIGGIELFELRRVERLHLELGQAKLASGKTSATSDLPVEVVCRGPFRFNLVEKVATFEDHVDVLRLNPDGPSDQLNCELLSIFFTDRAESVPGSPDDDKHGSKKNRPGAFDLQPQRIEARGNPVVVSAPGQQVRARGQRLEYDFQTGRIAAEGPGWFCKQMAGRTDQLLQAHWNEQLRVRPHEQNQVISLSGGAGLNFSGIGQLEAAEIHFWLSESPPDGQSEQSRLRPDRMLARGNVRVESPKLSSTVEQLEVWFEGRGARGEGPGARDEEGSRETPFSGRRHGGLPPTNFQGGNKLPPPHLSPLAPRPSSLTQHFEIAGRLLQIRVLMHEDEQAELSELIVEDGVRFVETHTKQPDEQPLLITGDRLHVVDAAEPHAAATVTGRPAQFEGRGLTMTGPNINLNRGTNRLWIDGPGQMKLPLESDLEGRPLRNPGTLQVVWQDRMAFDGRIARFEESVTADAEYQHLQTETLEVHLKQQIRFSDPKIGQDPEVEKVLCRGGVFMENRAFDGRTQSSHEQMQVVDLAINLTSGALTAGGPGWLLSVRRGDENQLRGLHVRFQGSITGNLHRRQMTFHDRVQSAYAPVDCWEAKLDVDNPDALGPDGVVLHCDRLSVNQMDTPVGDRRAIELEAAGNTVVEGNTFTARAIRMTYTEAKDLLVLEGDGRTDAELFRQQQIGGPTSKAAARKILYWPSTKQIKVIGAKSLELSQFPTGNALGPAQK